MNVDSGATWALLLGVWAVVCAIGALITIAVIPVLILLQRRYAVGQQIYSDAPSSHAVKQGTPTMGGIAFVAAAAAGAFIPQTWLSVHSSASFAIVSLVIAAGAVGFIDDFLIVVGKRPLGLRARIKFGLLLVIAIGFVALQSTLSSSHPQIWFGGPVQLPAWLWWFLSVSAIVGAANAVNLSDGLDGLAAGAAIPTLVALGIFSDMILLLPVIGACAAFLLFNRHPARIFMGDTGSLALGALMGGVAVHFGLLLVLPLAGIVFVLEALSVMLQVASFQTTGKRIFRMTPLHHHFELSGWKEWQVTLAFIAASWIAAIVISAGLYTTHAVMGMGVPHVE